MRFYDHQHMTGLDLRRILAAPEPDADDAPSWRMVLELVALAGVLWIIVWTLEILR